MICEKIHVNENNDKVILTTYLTDPSLEMTGDRKKPAVLILGGGAYFSVSDSEGEPVALRFSAMGYQAFTLKYSTYGVDAFIRGFQNMERRRNTEHPEPVRDVARAVKYIYEHAEEWRVDKKKIIICGFSAGAHNAAMYLTHWYDMKLMGELGCDPEVLKPAAGILSYPITDYVFMKQAIEEGRTDRAFFGASDMAFVGTKEPTDKLLQEISPARAVSDKTPPCFIWTTSADKMVPAENSLLMAMALAKAGVPYELHVFEEGDHGLSLADQSSAAALDQIRDDVHQWVGLAESWLKKRFSIEMPPAFRYEDADKAIAGAVGLETGE